MDYVYPTSVGQISDVQFSVFPNPAADKITINLPHPTDHSDLIEIFNTSGKILYRGKTSTNPVSIDVSKYTDGLYLIKLTTESSNSVRRFCKL